MNQETLSIALDLHNKCGEDVVDAIARNIELGNDANDRVFIAMAAPIMSGMMLMGLLTDPDKLNENLSNEEISGRTLFALLFAWHVREPRDQKLQVKNIVKTTREMWERTTGRSFDGYWLQEDLAKHLNGVVQ